MKFEQLPKVSKCRVCEQSCSQCVWIQGGGDFATPKAICPKCMIEIARGLFHTMLWKVFS